MSPLHVRSAVCINHQTSLTPKEYAGRWQVSWPYLVGLVERKSLWRDLWELQIMSIDFIHDCKLVVYKQLIQTGFGCYPSDFTLCWDFLYMRTQILGEPPHTCSIASQ